MEKNANIEIPEERKGNQVSDVVIYEKNKKTNTEKFVFFNFLIYNTKIESNLEYLQSYLFWVGILEFFVWIVLLALFISSPSHMAAIWVFFYHNARATVGMFIVRHMPKTHSVIENLKDYENSSLDEIQKTMNENYLSLIQDSEKVLRPLLITYTVLTFISVIADVIIFLVVAVGFDKNDYAQKNFFLLIAIVAYISKKL
jgi:uncharacterized membrane protein YbhN (UPF0104 family)